MDKINISTKEKEFNKSHNNVVLGEVNDHCQKFAINSGEYQVHNHPNSDEAFTVINNSVTLRLDSEEIELNEMDIFIMTKGINHKPISRNRTGIVFFESRSCEGIMK